MRKAYTFLILGVWLAILPYLGFPYSWKDILTTITGLAFVYFSFELYREFKKKEFKNLPAGEAGEKNFDNFSENQPPNEIPSN